MTKRRRNDVGSIRRNKSGTYSVRYTAPDGTRRAGGSYPTEREAKKVLRAYVSDIERDQWEDERKGEVLFSELAAEVLAMRKAELSPGTYRNHVTLLNRHLLPTFGERKVKDITIQSVDRWWSKNADHPVNRRNGYFLLSSIMKHAVRYELIKASPCQVNKAGKDVAKARPTFTVEDFRRVVDASPEKMHAVLWVMFSGHLRIGEVCGLNRGDFDVTSGVLSVERQDYEVGGRRLRPTKTQNRKEVTLLGPGLSALAQHVAEHPMLPSAPMFTADKGGRINRGYIRKHWATAIEEAGLPGFHIHDVRAVSLTLVAQAGATTREIMQRGGHSSFTAAMRYQTATMERDAKVASKADELLALA